MDWIKVLPQEELPDGRRRVVDVDGRPVLLVNHQGQIYAVANVCPHMGASLENGQITEEGTIICPRHHSAFDLRTGVVQQWAPWPPGIGRLLGSLAKQKPLTVHPTRTEEGSIWIGVEGHE
jgi:nitrite reductase/ring-hydroxylating ferredoxin subunit